MHSSSADIPDNGAPSETVPSSETSDQIAYLQRLLDQAHRELAEYRSGFIGEIRKPLIMELVALAQAIETYLGESAKTATPCRDFLEIELLGDIRQALNRYGVEPFVCASSTINRRLQRVVRVETTGQDRAGRVERLARGYADSEQVFQKEQIILYRPANGSTGESEG
jgi:molecular chaperone GrpE (heat shock protein)